MSADQPTSARAQPRTLVLVDDNEDLRFLLRRALDRSEDFVLVGEAADGAQGVAAVTALCPDVVLLDITMPHMDGLQALTILRRECPDTTVVMLSGFHESHVLAQKAVELGAHGYVSKGERLNLLVGRLRDIVDRTTRTVGSPSHHPGLEPDR